MVVECSNPLAWLRHREFGAIDGIEKREIILRRLSNLSLDGDTRLQSQAAGGITCLTVDTAEQRYALAAAQDGSVQCFDILGTSKETPEQPLFTVSPRTYGTRENGGHTASATAAAWFPNDNGAFVSCSKDMTAKLWDPNATSLVASFSTIQPANTLSMSPQQPLAAVGCEDSCIRLLDVTAGVATHTLMGYGARVMSVAWCGAHEHQVVGGDASGELRLFDIRRAGTLHSFDLSDASMHPQHVQAVTETATDATERTTVAPGGHNILSTAPVATRAHDGAITGLTQTSDARWWVSAGTDNAVRVWKVEDHTNSLLRFPGAMNSARCTRQIVVDPSSQVLYFPSGSVVSTYNLATGQKQSDLRGHHATINAAAWSPRQASLLTGSTDKQLLLWSPGGALQDSTIVCMGGDDVVGDKDADSWSDDDVIGAAAMRGPDWEGGAAGELRSVFSGFSGGRIIAGAARDVVTAPEEVTETATYEPDGNAAPENEDSGGEGGSAAPQRLQAVSEAALAQRRGRAGGGRGRGGFAQGGPSNNAGLGGVRKVRKADEANQRIKRIAAKLVKRLTPHMPQGVVVQSTAEVGMAAGRAAIARATGVTSCSPCQGGLGPGGGGGAE